MNLEAACQAADAVVLLKTGQHLTDVQMLILRGALTGLTYEEIAANSHYSVSYIQKFAGPTLWDVLSQALGEPVSKTNFQTALVRAGVMPSAVTSIGPPSPPPTRSQATMVGIPQTTVFFGRELELETLHQWIIQDQCRMVLLAGIGGIGKTTLMARFARQFQPAFERVVLQSCNPALPFPDFCSSLLRQLQPEADGQAIAPNALPQQVMEILQTQRCLLLLDDVADLLQGGELAGQCRPDCEHWATFWRQLAAAEHQSCVVLLGRELPAELVTQAGSCYPIRHWKLRGLSVAAAQQLLQAKGVNPAQSGIEELIHMKRGNPLALQLVATTIQELFAGNVAQLLKQSTVIIGDTLLALLNEQFERLSEVEKGVMYWLVLERQSLNRLKENTRFMIASLSELLKTLESLKRRSLLEEETTTAGQEVIFTLQPIVLRHTLTQLVTQLSQDVLHALATESIQDLGLLRTHLLFSDDQFYALRQAHPQLIEQALLHQLQRQFGDRKNMHQQLQQLLVKLHEKTNQAIGYATTNLVNLQRITESQRL